MPLLIGAAKNLHVRTMERLHFNNKIPHALLHGVIKFKINCHYDFVASSGADRKFV